MNPWSALVHAFTVVIQSVGAWVGDGTAAGIVVTIVVLRSALIPILLPLAVRTRARQRVVRRIRPQIKALDRELRDHPGLLSKRLKELHQENGIAVVDWAGLGGALIQVPLLIAMFQAVLIVWEPQALTLAGMTLGLLGGGLSLIGTRMSGQAEGATWMLWMSGLLPLAICAWLGTGVGLYLVGFYSASALQGAAMRERTSVPAQAESEET